MNDEISVIVEKVSKTFRLPHEKSNSVKSMVINFWRSSRTYEKQKVLENISFDIKKGEFFGIVGKNGSGKSTLLKILAGIYQPSKGQINIYGRLTPFIELGVGFNPELTGRENVYLNGALLGFSRKEIEAMYHDIVAFAELQKFMDQKLKNYSSGMQVRLAFSISIRANTDILLIDEVLAVGDAAFQQKCYEYFDKLKEEERTIVLVTHDMSAIKQFCSRALLIDDGRIVKVGQPETISQLYERLNYQTEDELSQNKYEKDDVQIKLINEIGRQTEKIEYGENIRFKISWPRQKNISAVGVVLYKGNEVIFALNSVGQECDLTKGKITLKLKADIGDGRYKVIATIFTHNNRTVLANSKIIKFLIYNQPHKGVHNDEWQGVSYLNNEWLND